MKKSISCLLVVFLLVSLLPNQAMAFWPPYARLEGVDYKRIISVPNCPFTLHMGDLAFEGGELRLGSPLGEDEEDRIIRRVENEMGITSGWLINTQAVLDFLDRVESLGLNDLKDLLMKLLGADKWEDFARGIAEGRSAADIAAELGASYAEDAAKAAAEALAGGGAGELISLAWDFLTFAISKGMKYQDYKDAQEEAAERRRMLDEFYKRCNKEIAKEVQRKGGGVSLFLNCMLNSRNGSFWGANPVVYWTVNMDLKLRGSSVIAYEKSNNFEGKLAIKGDGGPGLEQEFENTVPGKTFNQLKSDYENMQMTVTLTHEPQSPTVLTKLVDTEGRANLIPQKGKSMYHVPLNGDFDGEETFNLNMLTALTGKLKIEQTTVQSGIDFKALWTSSDASKVDCKTDMNIGGSEDYYGINMNFAKAVENSESLGTGTLWKPLDGSIYLEIDLSGWSDMVADIFN
ncbi:MAG: hypothetical protein FWE49_06765 [Synergistaceae bacterium]|nr:hypothetical protein [Synergistaceae bacterium]